MSGENGFSEYKLLILEEFRSLKADRDMLGKEIKRLEGKIDILSMQLAVFKAKAITWPAIVGAVPGIAALITIALKVWS